LNRLLRDSWINLHFAAQKQLRQSEN